MSNDELQNEYKKILKSLNGDVFNKGSDKYSGIFLPFPFEAYNSAHKKIMLIGRETAGWNTDNEKNTIHRIINANNSSTTDEIIDESKSRYKQHLKRSDSGKIITKSRSRFKQFYFRLAKELDLSPEQLIYANLFAWDYNKKSPLQRKGDEFNEICSISKQLLAAQIKLLHPDVIIFSAGIKHIDAIIKELFDNYFDGYNTISAIKGKMWQFNAANAVCFRIAHPRAEKGHAEFRATVIEKIKQL